MSSETKIVLSINAGSSSVKISVYSTTKGQLPTQLAEAQVSGLTAPPAKLSYSRGGSSICKDKDVSDANISSQDGAFNLLLKTLIDDNDPSTSSGDLSQLRSRDDVAIACHRIVHGGDFSASALITSDTMHRLEELNDLAPLHNAPSLAIVRSCLRALPRATNVACFDSQFHATLPAPVRTYAIDQQIARRNKLRKYGFHGLSYAFITRSTAAFLGKEPADTSLIALHLGSGASACAVRRGASVDTSMGLTPLAGLPGATRSGTVDPSLVFHYASSGNSDDKDKDVGRPSPHSTAELHISRAEEILNKEAGWKALAGTTNFALIADSDDAQHRLAFDLFVDRVCAFVGSYYVSLRGDVDALVFAGGIGEKSAKLRKAVVDQCACLGFTIDDEANAKKVSSVMHEVGKKGAKHRTLVCLTDEQFEMARGCAEDERLW